MANIGGQEKIDNMNKYKTCSICNKEFLKISNNQKYCKDCKVINKIRYDKEYRKRKYVILKDEKIKKTREYKLKKSINNKKYCQKNKKKLKQYFVEHYQKNRNKIKLRTKKWALDNPESARVNSRNGTRKYRVNKNKAEGSHTEQEWEQKKKEYNYCCVYCGVKEKDLKKKYKLKSQQILHRDHFIPLTKNGTDYIKNIRPACVSCNTSKGNNIIQKICKNQ